MNFVGLPWPQLAATFASAATIITALYLLRSRRKTMMVAFAALWQQVQRKHDHQHPWRKLQRFASWLLQILLAFLLCLALSDPQTSPWLKDPKTVAIIIDRSPSMSALIHGASSSNKTTRLDQAIELTRTTLQTLGADDRALVIASDIDVQFPLALGQVSGTAIRNIQALKPGSGDSALGSAIELARQLVHRDSLSEIKIFTDGAVDRAGSQALTECVTQESNCEWIETAGPNANVAITKFTVRSYKDNRKQAQALLEIQRFTSTPVDLMLSIHAGEIELARRPIRISGDSTHREFIDNIDIDQPRLRAQIHPLPESSQSWGPTYDDQAWAVILPPHTRKVVLVSDGSDLFLQAALLSLEDHIDLSFVDAILTEEISESLDDADIVIFDTATQGMPERLPNTDLIIFDPYRRPNEIVSIKRSQELKRPRITEQLRSHPILHNVVFKDVNLSRGTSFVVEAEDKVLLQHLDEALMVFRKRERALLAIGFDPRQSDMPMRIAFPLFIANAIEFMANQVADEARSVPLGLQRPVDLNDVGWSKRDVEKIDIIDPNDRKTSTLISHGQFRLDASQAGIYQIIANDGESKGLRSYVAVNQIGLDSSNLESLITIPPSNLNTDLLLRSAVVPSSNPIWMILIWVSIAILAIEWATFQRRKTV